jgi:reactive chlorine resistance protein C
MQNSYSSSTGTKLLDATKSDSCTGMETGFRVQAVGSLVLRYGLVLVIGWIGLMKFTEYEAKGIQPLVAHSPLMSWMYAFLTVRAFSNALGVVEVAIAILIGLRHWSAKASAIGSAGAVLMFLTTLSFLFSTPGWEPTLGGFPSLSALSGQFLLKDVVLLGAAIWSLGEAWTSSVRTHRKKECSP